METGSARKPPRRTQAERRETTRAALLQATIDCLLEHGYAGTTTTRVVERAGVSRGAQVHHFPTKAELVAEAVGHLAALRADEIRAELEKLPEGRRRTEAALDLIWKVHTGPLFTAAMELWVAGRTDPELRRHLVPIERRVNARIMSDSAALFGDLDGAGSNIPSLMLTSLSAARGLAWAAILLGPRSGNSVEAQWQAVRSELLRLLET